MNKPAVDYEKIISTSDPKDRVLCHVINRNKIFIKKSDPRKKRFFHALQEVAYWLTKNLLLAPSILTGKDTDFEVTRLRELRALGIKVPTVLYVGDNFFVMSDTGENLRQYLKSNPHEAEQSIEMALTELARLHSHGFVHGGAQIKNYTIKDGLVSLIDFEEKCEPQHVEYFKIRDVLLFLLSIEQAKFNLDIKKLCRIYQDCSGMDIYSLLNAFFEKYRWLGFFNRPFLKSMMGIDVEAFLNLLAKFQHYASLEKKIENSQK